MKLALQDVSVLFGNGDDGAANQYKVGYNETCLNAEYGYIDANGTKFPSGFPADCPYVTVGEFCSDSETLLSL